MNDFGNITLWATVGRNEPDYLDRTMRVIRYCMAKGGFLDAVLFSVIPLPEKWKSFPNVSVIQIPDMNKQQWEIWQSRTMPLLLSVYACHMAIHEDGFPIEWDLWENEFYQYDYIGAVWHDNVVGSGGCALTGEIFMENLHNMPWCDGLRNADEWQCRDNRALLESLGVKFATSEVAARYCTETTGNENKSFAFHGRIHCPDKYKQGWEQIETFEKENNLS